MSRVTLSGRAYRAVLLSVLVLLAAACSSSGSASGSPSSAGSASSSAAAPSASDSAALCSDVAALRGSLQELTSIRPSPSAATELRAAVQKVQTNLAGLSTAAGALWNEQVGNLRSALTKLQSAVSTLATQRNASSVSGVVTRSAACPPQRVSSWTRPARAARHRRQRPDPVPHDRHQPDSGLMLQVRGDAYVLNFGL
jgi:hypothetical protein